MKIKYTIQNQNFKRIWTLPLSLLFFFSCKELGDYNFNSKSIENHSKENLSKLKFTIIDPRTQEVIPEHIPLELGYNYLAKTDFKGKEKIYSLKVEKRPSTASLNHSSLKRSKRVVPLFFASGIAFIGTLLFSMHELSEAGKTLSKPIMVTDRNGNRVTVEEFFDREARRNLYRNEQTRRTNQSSTFEGLENQACSSRSLVNECSLPIENGLTRLHERMILLESRQDSIIEPADRAISFLQNINNPSNQGDLQRDFLRSDMLIRDTRSRRRPQIYSIDEIDLFYNEITNQDYSYSRRGIPVEFRDIPIEQLKRLNPTALKELLNKLKTILNIPLRIQAIGIEREFFARFLAYQAREEGIRIHIQNNIGSQQRNLIQIERLKNHLDTIIGIQRMLLRGILLTQNAINDEKQLGTIWEGLKKIIDYLDEVLEQEHNIYGNIILLSNSIHDIDLSQRNILRRIDAIFSFIKRENLFNQEQRMILNIEEIKKIDILNISRLRFNSMENIKDELSDFMKE